MRLPPLRADFFPAHSTVWDIVVASVFLVATTTALISAKTMAFTCGIFIAIFFATHIFRGTLPNGIVKITKTTLLFIAFLALCGAAVFRSADPTSAMPIYLIAIALTLAVIVTVRTIASGTPGSVARLAESLWIGLLVGMLYIIVRNVTEGQADSVMLPPAAHQFVKLGVGEVTRSIAPITLFAGPALLAIASGFKAPWRGLFMGMTVIACLLAIIPSPHETSKLALLLAAAVLGIANVSDRWAYRLLQTGWVTACLAIIPLAMLAKNYELQNASWLQGTARQRILIWDEFARRSLQAPVLGHGFDMSSVTRPAIPGLAELPYLHAGKKVPANLKPYRALHPHNVYLQIWYEFGAIGAIVFCSLGLTILARLGQLQPHQRPLLYGSAAAAAVIMFSSYGLWQIWFLNMLAFTAIGCAVAIKVSSGAPSGAMAGPAELRPASQS